MGEGQSEDRRLELSSHDPLILDGEAQVLIVESGSIAIFYAEVEGGAPTGPRRLLHRAGTGQAVVRVPHDLPPGVRFLVVPIKQASVRCLHLESAWSGTDTTRDSLAEAIDGWVEIVSAHLPLIEQPTLITRVSCSEELALEDGESLCAEAGMVLWCRIEAGQAGWMGGDQDLLLPESGWIPLCGQAWIRMRGAAKLRLVTTTELPDASAMPLGLGWIQARVIDALAERNQQGAERELVRLQSRDRLEDDVAGRAFGQLVSVLAPRQSSVSHEDPLLDALSQVGASLGITIRPPGESEGAGVRSDPVDAIARASRVRTRRVNLRGKWWKSDCGPLLAYSKDDEHRPLALLRRRSPGYEIYDPRDGSRTRVDAKSARHLHSEAVGMYRPLPDGPLSIKDLVVFSLVRRKADLVFALGTGLIATLLAMITPQATALLMDHAIPDADRRLVLEIGAGLLAAAIGITTFQLAQGIVLLRIGIRTESESQAALWDRLLRLPSNFFRRFSTGDLQSRIMAVNEIAQQVSGTTLSVLFSSFLALLNLALLYYYSPQLSILALGFGAVVMLTTIAVGFMLRRDVREIMDRDGRLFGLVIQLVGGVGKLRVAGATGRAFTHWLGHYSAQLGLLARIIRRRQGLFLFNSTLPTLSSAALFVVSYGLLKEGRELGLERGLTLGSFLAFNVAYNTFLGGVTSLSNTFVGMLDLHAKGQRIRPILEESPEVDGEMADPGRLTGRIGIERLEFRYQADGPKILDGVNLHAEPGEFIAIVGASGGGKSTLLRMLLGFEKPNSGSVTFDGQDLSHLDLVAVRRQMGVVLQSGRLDSASIFENLSGGGVLTLEEAWAAVESAGIADEIREMPMGMHTVLSVGGGNLSGGQRQRLLIARALAHRPRILIFDEATSALDNRTQQLVSESLNKLHVTRLVIAHRLSTIRNADRIYVLESGKIVQQGQFEELMEDRGGLFERMMTRQLT